MNNIIYIADPEILAVPIVECNEPLIDIKEGDQIQYGPPPECELTTDCYTKIRKSVYEKLCQAQMDLPKGLRFRLYEGYRSLSVQKTLFELIHKNVLKSYPHATPQEQFHETTRLVSPVINFDGSLNLPAHNTGGAVDIDIITNDGDVVDMGMEAKDWFTVDPQLCMTNCAIISESAKRNRQLLHDIMEAHGFVNYPTEWWHFSYGDRYWAYFKKAKCAMYGTADTLLNGNR
jgi:D-alanyl-D-alanine dipeptidase